MDALALAIPEERADDRRGFVVDPAEMYPAALDDIAERIEDDNPPARFVSVGGIIRDNPLVANFYQAQALGAYAFRAVPTRDECPAEDLPIRAEVLELARVWYTELLHQAIDYAPLGLHITKNEAWKL